MANNETFTYFVQTAPLAASINTSDLLALIQGGQTKRIPAAQLLSASSPTIVSAAGAYDVLTTDTFLAVTKTIANTIQLPSGPTFNQRLTVADCLGNAGTYPITIAAGAGDTIDGIAALNLFANWQSANLQYVQALNLWKTF
jgi:hypothetical protein